MSDKWTSDDQTSDKLSTTTRHDQVARRLQDEIERGKYGPGDPLPGEEPLAKHYGVSRPTVRKAIEALRAVGLVEVSHGRATRVRRPPLQLTLSRYSRAARRPGGGPFETTARDAGIPGYGELVLVEVRQADELLAGQLEIEPGDRYVYRRRYMHLGDDDAIVQIQEGHLPLAVVEGTALAGREKIVDGTYAALDAIGHGPASITERVTARAPTREESNLMIPPTHMTPVIEIVRTTRDADGTVVEVVYVTARADQNAFLYEDLPVD